MPSARRAGTDHQRAPPKIGPMILVLFAAGPAACGDADHPADAPPPRSLLVVVEGRLQEPLRERLEQYAETLRYSNVDIIVEPWGSGDVDQLKAVIFEHVDLWGIEGALLVGDLPAAWYEMYSFREPNGELLYETFPTDLYLQDREALWVDQDDDDYLDFHSELDLEIYTARLVGTEEQLQRYFDRVGTYRTEGPLVEPSAFIFIDDAWSTTDTSDLLGLNRLYGSVAVIQDPAESSLDRYVQWMTNEGAEFVYQAIHSRPEFLLIREPDETTRSLSWAEVINLNVKASFLNMFDCWAARFTEGGYRFLANAYTLGTEFGLASIGSTKKGAVRDSRMLHELLTSRASWGEAYRAWYNEAGKLDDRWHLGIVVIGDPLLRLTGDLAVDQRAPLQLAARPDLDEAVPPPCVPGLEPDTFEQYRQAHPEFFPASVAPAPP